MINCPFCDEKLDAFGYYNEQIKCKRCYFRKDKEYYFYYWKRSSTHTFSIDFKNVPYDHVENVDELLFMINNQLFKFPRVEKTKENVINALEQYYKLRRLMLFS
jgi:hypothetical protein